MVDNVYSLLGQATTDEYRRRREEERKYYKDLQKDQQKAQLKALLLKPLIGAAATTGMEAVTGLVADRFLPEKGASFGNTEAGRALGVQISQINTQKKQLQEELDFYNTPDAPTKMAEIIYKDSLAKMGAIGDNDKEILKQLVYADKETISKELDAYRGALKQQITFLDTAPTAEQIATRLQDNRYYYGKNKLQKLFSTAFNKIFGKDMDEVRQRSRNFLITGSEDPDYKTKIFDSMSSSKAFQDLIARSEELVKGDDRLLERSLQRLATESDSKDLYNSLIAKGENRAKSLLNAEIFFTGIKNKYINAQAEAEENGTDNPYAGTLGYKIFISPEFEKFRIEGDIKGFKEATVKSIFGGSSGTGTYKDFKDQSLATSREIAEARDNIQKKLDDLNPDIADEIKQQDAYVNSMLDGAFSEAETIVNNLAYDSPAFANFTPNEIKLAIRKYVSTRAESFETLDSENVPLVLKELDVKDQERLMMNSLAFVRESKKLQAERKEQTIQTRAKLNTRLEELLPRIQNDDTIQDKYGVAKAEVLKIVDVFKEQQEKGIFTQEDYEIFDVEIQKIMGDLETMFAPLPPESNKRRGGRGSETPVDIAGIVSKFVEDVVPDKPTRNPRTGRKRSLLGRSIEYDMSVDELIQDTVDKETLKLVDSSLIKTVADIESSPGLSTEERAKSVSTHDAHGIMQIKTITATQPGYGVNDIFKIAKDAGVSYDTDLEAEARSQIQEGKKKLTGKAGQEVKRLLSMPSLNIAFGSSYLDAFMTKYEGDKVATLIAYNAGPVAADRFIKFNRDRSTLPKQTQNYLTKAGL
tara:strand:- start:4603 stop:7038 length:2436 start_codon:yes stop_codon:yes gene_type:complete